METRRAWLFLSVIIGCSIAIMTNVRMTLSATLKHTTDLSFEIPDIPEKDLVQPSKKLKENRLKKNGTNDTEDMHPLIKQNDFIILPTTTTKQSVRETKIKSDLPIIKLVLLRSIGNSLPPRHDPEQAYLNLQFTLENERDFPHLRKHWILNRLVDSNILQRLRNLLDHHGQNYTIIPFNLSEYEKVSYNYTYYQPIKDVVHTKEYLDKALKGYQHIDEAIYQDKNLFVTNQNAARNSMIDIGVSTGEDWILPWDGNCFLHPNAYEALYAHLQEIPESKKYAYTPMNRAQYNEDVLTDGYQPNLIEEPQVILRHSAKARFHPLLRYGRRNKVEFLQRLKIKGPWDRWSPYLQWEKENLGPFFKPIVDLDEPTPKVGWVTRLSSGQQHLEKKGTIHERGISRSESMKSLLGKLDARVAVELHGFKPGRTLLYFQSSALSQDRQLYEQGNISVKKIVDELLILADKALRYGPWSVMDKPDHSIAASGDKHDYFHLSPYYWPPSKEAAKNPTSVWKRRDGKRYPGTNMHEPGSNNFDRTRLSDMQYNTTILSLAYFMTGKEEYAQVAARNIRTWFLAPESRMNPHMNYAQVVNGKNSNLGQSFGIIETKDFYFFLDAVHLIEEGNVFLNKTESSNLRSWFREYLNWLETSTLGKQEYTTNNNHGLFYDIQATSIASFTNDTAKMIRYIESSTSRMSSQIANNGAMIEELRRPTCEHYQMFTLQGWSTLARIARSVNRDLWLRNNRLLCNATRFTIPFLKKRNICKSKVNQSDVNVERWLPLLLDAEYQCPELRKQNIWPEWFPTLDQVQPPLIAYDMPIMFNTHDGVAPFWNLGLDRANYTLSSFTKTVPHKEK